LTLFGLNRKILNAEVPVSLISKKNFTANSSVCLKATKVKIYKAKTISGIYIIWLQNGVKN